MTDGRHVGPSARVYGVAFRDRKVLLVRASAPHEGGELWWLPGGGVDWGESVETALIREFEEETSLAIHDRLLCTISDDTRTRPNGDLVHTLRIVYLVTVQPGEIRHEADGSTDWAEWVDLADLATRRLAPYARDAIELALDQLAEDSPVAQETSSTIDRIRRVAGVN
ncbi:MAG: NUDIX domain-containing protein [Acidobacteria bacterium]|nr:NUDIX domain-containing protein [Acidobacteriota bacterium]